MFKPMLAKNITITKACKLDLTKYFVQPKLDGVRASWDGKQLLSRTGKLFTPSENFLSRLPTPEDLAKRSIKIIEGELLYTYVDNMSRLDRFSKTVSIVRSKSADWYNINMNFFDCVLANPWSSYTTRHRAMIGGNYRTVNNYFVKDKEDLMRLYKDIIKYGQEGLMLKLKDGGYQGGVRAVLKLKPKNDFEVKVVGVVEGLGKYKGMIGALKCLTEEGASFNVGSGLNDEQRKQAHTMYINKYITVEHEGLGRAGRPRFPVFKSIRNKGD